MTIYLNKKKGIMKEGEKATIFCISNMCISVMLQVSDSIQRKSNKLHLS